MPAISVTYIDGTRDVFVTDGGETDALAAELAEDLDVASFTVDYDDEDER